MVGLLPLLPPVLLSLSPELLPRPPVAEGASELALYDSELSRTGGHDGFGTADVDTCGVMGEETGGTEAVELVACNRAFDEKSFPLLEPGLLALLLFLAVTL